MNAKIPYVTPALKYEGPFLTLFEIRDRVLALRGRLEKPFARTTEKADMLREAQLVLDELSELAGAIDQIAAFIATLPGSNDGSGTVIE